MSVNSHVPSMDDGSGRIRALAYFAPSLFAGRSQRHPRRLSPRLEIRKSTIEEIQMHNRSAAVLATIMLTLFCATGTVANAKGGAAVFTPAPDVKWADVPGFPGVQMAVLNGNPAKGAHHSMLKFKAGFEAPLHHHTTDHYGTVVAGTLVLTSAGKEVKLPPGSYFSFTGKMPHSTKCDAGADCVVAVDARGKWDVVPEGGKAKK